MSPNHFPTRKNLLLAGAILAALGATAPAEATTIPALSASFTLTQFLFTTPPNDTASDSITGTFAQFDPTLGTLTQVDIELLSRITGGVSATGFCTVAGDCSPDASSTLAIDLAVDVDGITPVFSTTINTGADCTFHGLTFCNGSQSFNELFNGSFLVPADGGALADFIGLGTVSFGLSMDSTLDCTASSGANCTGSANPKWANGLGATVGSLTITYTYTPAGAVPEPASLALVGLGAAGLWLTRRRHAAGPT